MIGLGIALPQALGLANDDRRCSQRAARIYVYMKAIHATEPHAMQLLSQGTNVFTMAAAWQETIASTTGVAASTIVDHSAVVRP